MAITDATRATLADRDASRDVHARVCAAATVAQPPGAARLTRAAAGHTLAPTDDAVAIHVTYRSRHASPALTARLTDLAWRQTAGLVASDLRAVDTGNGATVTTTELVEPTAHAADFRRSAREPLLARFEARAARFAVATAARTVAGHDAGLGAVSVSHTALLDAAAVARASLAHAASLAGLTTGLTAAVRSTCQGTQALPPGAAGGPCGATALRTDNLESDLTRAAGLRAELRGAG
jgi:hypothetical protein